MDFQLNVSHLAREWLHPYDVDCVYFHKSCTDGAMAAAVALLFNSKLEVIAFGYDQEVADLPDLSDKRVLFVDVALTKEKYDMLVQKCKRLLVLDHHATAQTDISGHPGTFFDMERSGCTMAWDYFFPGLKRPKLLTYIESRDLWKMDEDSRAFTTFFYDAFPPNPQVYWSLFYCSQSMDNWIDQGIAQGMKMEEEKEKTIQRIAKKATLVTMCSDPQIKICAIECNDVSIVSDLGSYIAKQHGIALIWSKDEKSKIWKGSLRSVEPHDSSHVAKLLGGGGHKHASGFTTPKPIIGHHFLPDSESSQQPKKKSSNSSFKKWVPKYHKTGSKGFDKWADARNKKYHSSEL